MKDLPFQDLFSKGLLLTACLLCVWFSPVQASERVSIVVIPETPAEGQNVTFSVQNVTGTIRQIDWYRGQATNGGTRIFTYFPGNDRPQRNGVQHTQREFGFPNGSLFISDVQLSDAQMYSVLILLRSGKNFKGTTDLHLAGAATNPPLPVTTTPPPPPPVKEPTKGNGMMGWIVAGIMVGVLLAGAVGSIMVYRFVLKQAEPCTGVAGKLDPRGKKPLPCKHNDKEPIYEVMDSPVESPSVAGKQLPPISGPLPSVPCPKPDSNYTDLLQRTESIYSEIKR